MMSSRNHRMSCASGLPARTPSATRLARMSAASSSPSSQRSQPARPRSPSQGTPSPLPPPSQRSSSEHGNSAGLSSAFRGSDMSTPSQPQLYERPSHVTEYVVASRLAQAIPALDGDKRARAKRVLEQLVDVKPAAEWLAQRFPGATLPPELADETIGTLDVKYPYPPEMTRAVGPKSWPMASTPLVGPKPGVPQRRVGPDGPRPQARRWRSKDGALSASPPARRAVPRVHQPRSSRRAAPTRVFPPAGTSGGTPRRRASSASPRSRAPPPRTACTLTVTSRRASRWRCNMPATRLASSAPSWIAFYAMSM